MFPLKTDDKETEPFPVGGLHIEEFHSKYLSPCPTDDGPVDLHRPMMIGHEQA